MINIDGLDKAEVLKVLYDNAKVQGLGLLDYVSGEMTIQEAKDLLKMKQEFDYLHGRVMKVDLTSDITFDERLYDENNGYLAAAQAINSLRFKETDLYRFCKKLEFDEKFIMKHVIMVQDIFSMDDDIKDSLCGGNTCKEWLEANINELSKIDSLKGLTKKELFMYSIGVLETNIINSYEIEIPNDENWEDEEQ